MSAHIDVRGLGIQFHFDRQRRVLTPTLARIRRGGPAPWALRGIDLSVAPGEGVAFVGPTGSGKTTLLRLIGGILAPDEGALQVRGRVGTLLSPQAGLLGLLTGRENAELLGVLVGMSPREARAAVGPIRGDQRAGQRFRAAGEQLLGGDAGAARLRGRRAARRGPPPARRGARGDGPRVPRDRRPARDRRARPRRHRRRGRARPRRARDDVRPRCLDGLGARSPATARSRRSSRCTSARSGRETLARPARRGVAPRDPPLRARAGSSAGSPRLSGTGPIA